MRKRIAASIVAGPACLSWASAATAFECSEIDITFSCITMKPLASPCGLPAPPMSKRYAGAWLKSS